PRTGPDRLRMRRDEIRRMIVRPVASKATGRTISGVVILIPVGAATAAASKKADRTNRPVAKKWCCPHRGSRVVFSRWEISLVSLLVLEEHPQITQITPIQEKHFSRCFPL